MRFFDAATVDAALSYPALVDILQQAFAQGAISPPRHHHAVPGGDRRGGFEPWRRIRRCAKILRRSAMKADQANGHDQKRAHHARSSHRLLRPIEWRVKFRSPKFVRSCGIVL